MRVPSGAHAGRCAPLGTGRGVWAAPFADITTIVSPRWNTILEPSGDQSGFVSSAGSVVRGVAEVPVDVIVQMSKLPATLRANTILVPFGDHAGAESSRIPEMSGSAPVPSAFIT